MEFIEELALFYEKWGVPRIGGKILGLLLTEEGKLSSEDIASKLAISKGSVSTNLRLLINVGWFTKKAVPGDPFIITSSPRMPGKRRSRFEWSICFCPSTNRQSTGCRLLSVITRLENAWRRWLNGERGEGDNRCKSASK